MIEIFLIIFTSMEPTIPPTLQEIPMYSMETCLEAMDTVGPKLRDMGVVYTMRCEKRKRSKSKEMI